MGETVSGKPAKMNLEHRFGSVFYYLIRNWEWWITPGVVIISLICWSIASDFIKSAILQHQEDKAAIEKVDKRIENHVKNFQIKTDELNNELKYAKKEINRLQNVIDDNKN
jgi:peptidoglycan hydrolase CwlO-like protein